MRYSLIYYLNLLSIFFIVLIAFGFNSIPNEFTTIIFLPITYILIININGIKQIISRYFTLKIYFFLAFLKYVVLTYIIISTDNYDSLDGGSSRYLPEAYFLMAYELIVIGLFLSFWNRSKTFKKSISNSYQISFKKNFILKISILIGLIGFVVYDEFLDGIIWFKDSQSLLMNENFVPIEGWFMGLIFYFSKFLPTLIFLILLNNLKRKYPDKMPFRYLMPTIFFGLLSTLLVFTENRGIIVSTGITTVVLIYLIFPQFKRKLILVFGSIIFMSVVIATVFRMFNTTNISSDVSGNLVELFFVDESAVTLDAYLSGPSNVASGLKAASNFQGKISYRTLLNDLIINTNILNQISYRLIDTNLKNDRSSVYLNTIVSGSRIPPLINSGKTFLGTIFSPLFSIIAIFLMLFFERRYIKSKTIYLKYVWLFIAIRFSFNLGLSTSVLFGLFAQFFLPLWLLLSLNNFANKMYISWK